MIKVGTFFALLSQKDTFMQNFSLTPMFEIIDFLKQELQNSDTKTITEFEVINPDVVHSYNGNIIILNNIKYIYRGYKTWVDLAQSLHCRMLTPIVKSKNSVIIKYEKLDSDDSFHKLTTNIEEKYGADSIFSKIHKNEESSFLSNYLQSLDNVNIDKRKRVLNLGVNSGDEFEVIQNYSKDFDSLELVGIDYCPSAIALAKNKFKNHKNILLIEHDINDLNSLNLGKFDLIVTIGTLQSSNLEFNPLFMSIIQNQLKKDGAMIIGFPNCRWIGGEMIYGAKVKNYPFSEMGILYKDVMFCKKYLQQKKFRVSITGKDYIFLTATSIRKD